MKTRLSLVLPPLALLPLAAATAAPLPMRLVVPAAAHAAGANGSSWATDVDLYNAGLDPVPVTVAFVADGTAGTDSAPAKTVVVPAGSTLALSDVLGDLFALESASGALALDFDPAADRKLAIGSRTYNRTDAGTFGQSIAALDPASGLGAGQTGVLFAPIDPVAARLNFGAFAVEETVANWRLLSSGGAVVAEKLGIAYPRGTAARYNDGIRGFLGGSVAPGQVVQVEVVSGRLLPWASRIDNATNDGDFSLARSVRPNEAPLVVGLDTDGDGIADMLDADGNGVLDLALAVAVSSGFPYDMRIVARDPEGKPLTFTGLNLPTSVLLDGATGALTIWPGPSLAQTGGLKIRVSDGTDTTVLTIPVAAF